MPQSSDNVTIWRCFWWRGVPVSITGQGKGSLACQNPGSVSLHLVLQWLVWPGYAPNAFCSAAGRSIYVYSIWQKIGKSGCGHGTALDLLPAVRARASRASCTAPYPCAGNHPAVEKPAGKLGISLSELFCGQTINRVLRAVLGHFSELIFPHPVVPFHRPHLSQVNESVPEVLKAYKHHLFYQQGSISSCNNSFFQST